MGLDGGRGVFTARDAAEVGLAADDVRRMVQQGCWVVVPPQVYVSSGTPLTAGLREAAALAFYGPQAVLSHASAGLRHGLEVNPGERVFLTQPISCCARRRPGVVQTRTRRMPERQIIGGTPVTPVHRTVVDLSAHLDHAALRLAMTDAIRRNRTTLERILAAAEGMGGRKGLALLRRVGDEVDPLLESVLEEEAQPHLLAVGPGELERQWEVFDAGKFVARVDVAWPQLRLAVEIDGWAFHSTPTAQNRDARRDRRLAALGWTVLRFTTEDVRREPARMRKELAAVISRLERRSS